MSSSTTERSRADPKRVIAALEHLRETSGTDAGAQRVAWTRTWAQARSWLQAELRQLPVTVEFDEAGNLWATLTGQNGQSLVVGSHLDSVPNGGWLDGCLGVIGGARSAARIRHRPHTPAHRSARRLGG